jgi:hypothetical protein
MSSEEFSGVDFAAGTVRGTRSFKVDKLGRLTGVAYEQVWAPGENHAECLKGEDHFSKQLAALRQSFSFDYTIPFGSTALGKGASATGANSVAIGRGVGPALPKRSWIDAVLGAPATTAAIEDAVTKAKAEEEFRLEEERKEKERLAAEEEERRKRDTLADCSHGFYGYYDGSNDYYKAGMVMGVIEGYGETVIGTRGFRCMKARIVAIRIPKHVPDRLRKLVIRNYPDLPVFDTFKAMVAEFPPDDAGSGITPDTDPDFWTRTI